MAQKNQQDKKYWCNIFSTRYEIVAAICDEELLDKKLDFKKTKVTVSKKFYGGRLIDEDFAKKALKKSTIGNLFGKDIIAVAQKNGFITDENVIVIDGVPHAQFVKLQ